MSIAAYEQKGYTLLSECSLWLYITYYVRALSLAQTHVQQDVN